MDKTRLAAFGSGALVPIPVALYCEVFQGGHDIAFTAAAFALARASRSEKATLRDVVHKILLMSCKRIVNMETYNNFIFEVTLNGETRRLQGIIGADEEMTIMLEGEG